MLCMMSGVIFQPLIGYILDLLWSGDTVGGIQILSVFDYRMALICIPIALILAALMAAFMLRETYCKMVTR